MHERTKNLVVTRDANEHAMAVAVAEPRDEPMTVVIRRLLKPAYVERFGVQPPTMKDEARREVRSAPETIGWRYARNIWGTTKKGGKGPALDPVSEASMARGLRDWLLKAGRMRAELHKGSAPRSSSPGTT